MRWQIRLTVIGTVLKCLLAESAGFAAQQLVYVATNAGLQAIDTGTNELVSADSVPIINMAISPDGTRIYAVSTDGSVEFIDAVTKRITASIAMPYSYPGRIRLSPDGTKAYVAAAFGSTQLLAVDTAAQSATVISLGQEVQDLAISPDGKRAYLVQPFEEQASTQILVMDTATNVIVTTIIVPFPPDTSDTFIAGVFSPDGRFLYVPQSPSGSISVVDTITNVIVAVIPGVYSPQEITISSEGRFAYVSHWQGIISVIDLVAQNVAATITPPHAPGRIVLSADGSRLYAVTPDSCAVTVIDASSRTVVATIAVDEGPRAIALGVAPPAASPTPTPQVTATPSPPPGAARACAYVTHASGEVSVIDAHTQLLVGSFAVPESSHIALKRDGTRAYVTSGTDLALIDTSINAVTDRLAMGSSAYTIAMSSDGATAYVGFFGSPCYTLYAVDTAAQNVRQRIGCTDCFAFPSRPPLVSGIAISPDGQRAYVSREMGYGGVVSVIDLSTGTTIATIAFDETPVALTLTPDGRTLYVSLYGRPSVAVIDTAIYAVTNMIRLGGGSAWGQTWAIAAAPDGKAVYVAHNENNGAEIDSVSVITTPANLDYPNKLLTSVRLDEGPAVALAITPDGAYVYAVEMTAQASKVAIISTAGPYVAYRVDVPPQAQDIAIANVPYGCVAPLNPIPTATWTPTASATSTPTISPTPSVTATHPPTATATVTVTATPTPSQTPWPTSTATPIPTSTPTLTPSVTPSPTAPTGGGSGCAIVSSEQDAHPNLWGWLFVSAIVLRRELKRRASRAS